MKSVTKFNVSDEQIREVFREAKIGEITEICEISDGWYNSVFSATDLNGNKYVLKIAPSKDVKILSHEKDMMKSEVFFYNLLSEKTAVKTPKIIFSDFSQKIIPTAYFIMEFLKGERFDKAKLSPEEKQKADEQWAWILSEFHKVPGEGYGYKQAGLHSNWQEAFSKMTQMLIDDAASFGKKCKVGKKLLEYIDKFSQEIQNVPCVLVNFDLHAMNMFCTKKEDGGIELAVLDLERCFFGDPIGDFIMYEFMKDFASKGIIASYNRFADMQVSANRNEQIRYNLLLAYLAVIMYTERFSRFRGFAKYFNPVFLSGTIGYKLFAKRAFSNLKKLSNEQG